MIQITSDEEIIYTVAEGMLTGEDYARLTPILQTKIQEHQKIRWYFEMQDFKGWGFKALWEDVKFDVKHANDFEKIAMVGDKGWEKALTQIMKPFTAAEIKYFELTEKEEAKKWIAA